MIYICVFLKFSRRQIPEELNPVVYVGLCVKQNLSWTEKCSDPFGVCFEEVFDAFNAVTEVRLVQVMRFSYRMMGHT